MKQTIKHIILFFTLVIGSIGHAWAIAGSDIIINIQPNNTAGTVSVTSIEGMKVTISATPASGYSIDAAHIIAEKMVDPMAAPSHHAPGIASKLDITDNGGNSFSFTIPAGYTGAYVTVNFYKATPNGITSLDQITDLAGTYVLTADVDASGFTGKGEFTGTLDGGLHKIYNLSKPLFSSTNGAVIRNIIFEDVNISSGDGDGDAGVVTPKAGGDTRIYNCGILPTSAERDDKGNITGFYGSSVSGTRYVGSLVGFLDGTSRVINCYSYANVSGGSYVGGIVGYNNVATTATNLKTMVMNCMFYGEVSGSSKAPIYNGINITNRSEQSGVSNFNYFWAGASYVQNRNIDVYNCALSAETRFLQRFEFFRHLLNSNRELAAWWATGSRDNKDEMMKWVLEPSQIGSFIPYPILKTPGKYPSVVNIDADHAEAFSGDAATKKTQYNQGRKFGTLTINIQNASSGSGSTAPAGASITTTSVTPNITDKDPAHFNFNYYKVQLPYYNDVGTNNYTDNKVVTGWKIVAISGGTHSFSDSSSDATATTDENGNITLTTPYNFADRKCTDKDLYSVSGRVFSQGAYFDVPEGVSSITIEPYWGKCVYVSDAYPDVVYNQAMSTAANVTTVGGGRRFTNKTAYDINGNSQTVYTSMSDAVTALNPSGTVYDNAIVLVGNVHISDISNKTNSKPYTIMSIDLDKDNEPDFSYILRFNSRVRVHPVRVDFINIMGLGMAQKSFGGTGTYNLGILQPYGWFESTNTSLFRLTQFEYDYGGQNGGNPRLNSPMILQGGVIEQWVTVGGKEFEHKEAKSVTYYHVGGNVWFKEFHIGVHQDKTQDVFVSPHPPISVTGGDYDVFYLTGNYNTPNNGYDDNAECYINGGRFNKVAGTGMQGIGDPTNHTNGNITWQIDNADINEFYGGGINAAHIAQGNIMTIISNSRVDQFCGGPKFGDMNSDKKVVTNATNCTFRTFFGAGYGGNSYNRRYPDNQNNKINIDWNSWVSGQYTKKYDSKYGGVETRIDYQFLPMSGNTDNVCRLYVDYVNFSLATTRDVTSKLTDCTITKSALGSLDLFNQCVGNFYGGGNLGMVDGPVKSTLKNCNVEGSVFGAGYSASLPPVAVMNNSFQTQPYYDSNLGAYLDAVMPSTETYTWEHRDVVNSTETAIDKTNHILYTTADLTTLGAVSGKATLNIDGTTTVAESVYGGGEESGVGGDTEVTVTGGTIGTTGKGGAEYGNVYGGGKGKEDDVAAGQVKGNTNINISGSPYIIHNVYGGGAYGSVGDFTYDPTSGMPTACAENTGVANITITGGTFGSTGHENGMIFGSSRGLEGNPETNIYVDKMAWVGNTNVVIGTQNATSNESPWIKGSVYGGGENGHNYKDAHVTVHSGTIGITDSSVDGGARYPYRGNVYGGGCGTDTYSKTEGEGDNQVTFTYYDFNAGIVLGNTQVDIDGGHIVHNVYGGGAMGSVGTYTLADAAYNTEHPEVPVGKPYACADGTGTCTINITGGQIGITNATMTDHGTDGPDDCGHVFGAGRGTSNDPVLYPNIETTAYFNTTNVTIGKTGEKPALVCGSVYGGSESGHVLGNTNVTIAGGQIGCGEGRTTAYSDSDFNVAVDANGNYTSSLPGTNHWTYTPGGAGAPYDEFANINGEYPNGDSSEGGLPIATDGRTFYGNVFAGGSGYYPYAPGKWLKSAGRVEGTATVTLNSGHILNNLYGGCEMADIEGSVTVNVNGGTIGVPRTQADITANPNEGNIYGAGMGDKRIFFNTSTNVASTTVNITNGTIYGAVYGGGEDGHVIGNAVTTIEKPATGKSITIGCNGGSGYDGNVFGAGQGHYGALTSGVVGGNAELNVKGGTIKGSVYGGGRIASVGTHFAMATIDDPNNPGQQIPNPQYGQMTDGDNHGCLTVNLTGGTVYQNVYGGCMGTTEGLEYGISKNVAVNLNKNVEDAAQGCVVKGVIFGCNNVNSSPEGTSTVHIYATQRDGASRITNAGEVTNAKVKGTETDGEYILSSFDVQAVYGGGNLAAYTPKSANGSTNVIIDGCERTSIGQVYGGGNAASTPATNVEVNGTFEIGELFGGGNGKDRIIIGGIEKDNPGANVGFKDYSAEESTYDTKEKRTTSEFISKYVYGTGKATVNIKGGTIHRVFGGSNTKGNVRLTALTMLEELTDGGTPICEFHVDEAYGGGKSAPMDAEAKLLMACIPGLNEVYGGAEAADVRDDVTLTITNGTFNRVFGGNNISGTISGKITVNIEEVGCKPIVIGELYGGGNLAPYSVYGYDSNGDIIETGTSQLYNDPVVNVRSFTSIGTVYGGGYGAAAVMVGSPHVNISESLGDPDNYPTSGDDYDSNGFKGKTITVDDHDVVLPSHTRGKMGAINDVFGGGNAAPVKGNTHVNIGTTVGDDVYLAVPVETGATLTDGYYTRSGAGTEANPYTYTAASGTAVADTTYYKKYEVLGVDIRGNVYGGGNNAEVTGNTNVTIGKQAE